MLKYVLILDECESKRFYREKLITPCGCYLDAKRKLINKYNNFNRQIYIYQKLKGTTISSIISQHSSATSVSLEKPRYMITTYTLQRPVSYRTEEEKV